MTDNPEPSATGHVNLFDLLDRVEQDRQFLADLLANFNTEFPILLARLRDAAGIPDMRKVEMVGHSLKGMMATMSFERATATALSLEDMGRGRIEDGLQDLIGSLETEVKLAAAELESFCAGTPQ